MSVRISRNNNQVPWGFRIHGGRDFNQPIIVLKVTGGSLAASSGLTPGDTIVKINGKDALALNHKDAEGLIKNAGNQVELEVIKANSSTWKPQVQVLSEPNSNNESGQTLVNKQFNTPINIYSEQSIAETLSAQAEVLAGGAIGVNFKKNEKKYNYEDSEVYKMLQESENDHSGHGHDGERETNFGLASPNRVISGGFDHQQHQQQQANTALQQQQKLAQQAQQRQQQQLLAQQSQQRLVQQQQAQQQQQQQQQQQFTQQPIHDAGSIPPSVISTPQAPTGPPPGANPNNSNVNICADCERLIVGVFVRIKDKNLHVDCFKCATCGQSLKNVGYYNINNKLYCDIHAKTVAKANPPAPGLEPFIPSLNQQPTQPQQSLGSPYASPPKPFSYTAPPTATVDTYAAKVAPIPFHHSPGGVSHVPAPKSPNQTPTGQPFAGTPLTQQSIVPQQQITFQQQPLVQQQQQQESSFQSTQTSSSYSESSYLKSSSTSSSFEQTSAGAKVLWPPLGQPLPALPDIADNIQPFKPTPASQQPKFKQPQVPYKPLSTLLAPAAGAKQTQQNFGQQQHYSTQGFNQSPAQFSAPQPSTNSPKAAPSFSPVSSAPTYAPAPAFASAPVAFQPSGFSPKPAASNASFSSPAFTPASNFSSGGPSSGGIGAGGGGPGGAKKGVQSGTTLANRIGRGILTQPGGLSRVAVCGSCQKQIRGPFITAGVKFYCPEHFKCANQTCKRDLIEIGFVEEKGQLYCEYCWESHIAPMCGRCSKRIKYEALTAIGQQFHPDCFKCTHCNKVFGKESFFLEDAKPYCDRDWNEMFTTKCFGCGFPIEAGDKWVEAINQNYHSQCFNCTACKKNLEGQSFFAKQGRPFCKSHAR